MITQLDIQRTAKIMIDQHGEDALFEAMNREHQFLYKNDTQGALFPVSTCETK